MRVTAVELFPRTRFLPGVNSVSTTINTSSLSITPSVLVSKDTHASSPSVELAENVSGTDDSGEKSLPAVARTKGKD